MIDSHAHLYFDRFDPDRDAVIARSRAAGVEQIINIGIDVETSRAAVELALAETGFHAAVGLHPTTAVDDLEGDLERLRALAGEQPAAVVAIGEIGLDYYWKDVPPGDQRPKLKAQLSLARELNLPVIYHCRDALADIFDLLAEEPSQPPGVFHCFGGGAAEAERALELGYHVSFAGNVTFPTATDLRQAAAVVPLERLLLETDAPFLAPQPRRGKRNEPAFVRHTAEFLAELKQVPLAELVTETVRNTERLFALGSRSAGRSPVQTTD